MSFNAVGAPRRSRAILGAGSALVTTSAAAAQGFANPLADIAAAASIFGIFSSGKARDAKRKARADYFAKAASAGVVLAGQYLNGGLQQVGSNEQPYYRDAIAAVRSSGRSDVLDAGAAWIGSDNAESPPQQQQMIMNVQRELQTLGSAIVAPNINVQSANAGQFDISGGTWPTTTATPAPVVRGLPAMQVTARYNWVPWAVVGVGAAVVLPRLFRNR